MKFSALPKLFAKLPIQSFLDRWMTPLVKTLKTLKSSFEGISKKGQIEKELKASRMLALATPKDVRVRLKIAELSFLQRDLPSAIDMYREVAEIYASESLPMKAIDAYLNVLRLSPTDTETNEKLGTLYREVGMIEEALQQFEIAFYAYRSRLEHNKALAMSEAMIALSPTPTYRRKLAEIHQTMGRTEEAIGEFEAIANEYRKNKQLEPLLEIYKILLPHRKSDKTFIRDMAILYLHKHQPQDALRLLEREKLVDDESCQDIYLKAKAILQELAKKK